MQIFDIAPEFALELLRLIAAFASLIFVSKFLRLSKRVAAYRAWILMVVAPIVMVLWSISSLLDDFQMVSVMTERILVRLFGLILVLVIFAFAAEFYSLGKSLEKMK